MKSRSAFKPKIGSCKYPGCNYSGYLVAGYCKYHNYKTKQDKKKAAALALAPDQDWPPHPGGMIGLFREIWEEREHVSFLSGNELRFNVSCFAHVLPKGKGFFPKYAYRKENIVLVTPEEHTLIDHGTEEKRKAYPADWNRLNRLGIELRMEYELSYGSTTVQMYSPEG